MAGASAVHLYMTNGQVLHVYVASTAAVGTNAPVSDQAAATSASNTDFTVSSDCCIRDQINDGTAATAGEMEVYNVSKAQRTGRLISQITASYAVSVNNRNVPRICFRRGQIYRFIQTTAQVS